MPSERSYLAFWLTVALVFYLLLAGSFLTMWLRPQTFYWRPWEYFSDIVYRNLSVPPLWEGEERGDRSREFFFLYQQSRHTRASTDEDGFRTVPYPCRNYPVAVLGDSTIFGSGLSDDETLPWRLALELGLPVFNGGRSAPDNALARPELAGVRLVLHGRTESALTGLRAGEVKIRVAYQPLRQGELGVLNSAPLALYFLPARLQRDLERIAHDISYLVKNRGQTQPYLFKRHTFKPAELDKVVAAVEVNHRILSERGITYVLVPVPASQTLYAPDVDGFTRSFIPRLCQRLRDRGIHAVDLATALEAHKHQGLFTPTDTHWNGQGTAVASRELAAYLRAAGLLEGLAAPADGPLPGN